MATAANPQGPQPLRVAVLDDDATFRAVLGRMLGHVGARVVASCPDIATARRRLEAGDVDAITIDVVLRGESGLDFLEWCRVHHPGVIPVLVTSGSASAARHHVDAVLLGAAALLIKPDAAGIGDFENELRRVFDDGRSRAHRGARHVVPAARPHLRPSRRRELLAVGASTGGPTALLRLLRSLPRWFDAPVVITQHMAPAHLAEFAVLLGDQTGRPTRIIDAPTVLERGQLYLAGGTPPRHLEIVREGRGLVGRPLDTPPEHHCRPAVDPMFASVGAACPGSALGVVLTGMGADGARGAQALRRRGNPVLIQDETSSVVWGMPGAVMNAGAADGIASLDALPTSILEWMDWKERESP